MSFGVLHLDKVSIKLKQNFLALMSKGVFSEKKKRMLEVPPFEPLSTGVFEGCVALGDTGNI